MEPTYNNEDHILIFRYWPKSLLRKGDIVLISSIKKNVSHNSDKDFIQSDISLIKRIVGLPGETIAIHYTDILASENCMPMGFDEHGNKIWHIPRNHLFVRGDNRTMINNDSVFWGPTPYRNILGIAIIKLSSKKLT